MSGQARNVEICRDCGELKPLDDFPPAKKSRDGRISYCRACAICQEREPQHVDHDHVTGRVRGVLCSCCNQALGNARDRTDVLRAAIDDLERTTWNRHRVCTGVYRLTTPRPAAAPSASSSELPHLISSRRG